MAEHTEHYGLQKPSGNDPADISVFNENFDNIDDILNNHSQDMVRKQEIKTGSTDITLTEGSAGTMRGEARIYLNTSIPVSQYTIVASPQGYINTTITCTIEKYYYDNSFSIRLLVGGDISNITVDFIAIPNF